MVRRSVTPAATPAPSIRRSSVAAFLSSGAGVVIGLGITIMIARSLGPAGKGSYDLAIATAGLLALALGLSMPAGIAYAVARGTAGAAGMARLAFALAAAVAAVTLLVLLIGSRYAPTIVGGFGFDALVAISAIVGVSSLAANLRGVLVGREMILTVSWLDLLGRILTAAAILLVIIAVPYAAGTTATYEQMLWATAVAGCALSIATATALRTSASTRGEIRGLRAVLGFALPTHLSNVVQFLNYRLDLFLVSAFTGLAAVGVYALAVSFAQMVWLAPSAIALPLLPRVASEASSGSGRTDISRLSRVSLITSLAAALAIGLLGPPFILVVYGPSFAGATTQLLLLLPGVAALGQATVLAAFIGGSGRQRLNLHIAVVALVVTVVCDVLLIPPLGGVGAAIASSLSYGCTAAITLVVAARIGSLTVRELLVPRKADVIDLARSLARMLPTRFGRPSGGGGPHS